MVHGRKDVSCHGEQVEYLTKLAIIEQWAPAGMLSFYDSEVGHMLIMDTPTAWAKVYRKAFEEQLLGDSATSEAKEVEAQAQ